MTFEIQDLLDRAEKAYNECEPLLAKKFLEKALTIQPNDSSILSHLGDITLELIKDCDDPTSLIQEAREHYMRSLEMDPSCMDFQRYVSLAQLCQGKEALEYYNKGSMILLQGIKDATIQGTADIPSLQFKLSSILCSMTEIYMTDCCEEQEAEESCERWMNQALQVCNSNPEVYQTLASVRLSQQRNPEAKDCIQKCIELWKHLESEQWPSYSNRMGQVKILIEVELYDEALELLESLQAEDDEDPEVWYLYAWCYYLVGGWEDETRCPDKEDTQDALECIDMLMQLHEKYNNVPAELLEHVSLLKQTMSS